MEGFHQDKKDVYNSVLYVMKEAHKDVKAGTVFKEYNSEIGRIMESEV